ncbi:hypothetical protein JGH11_19520, partial [Dysgonomonas sp. Marseille-P4677]|uniref:hypothetical protein n=1 Tax=Dysgonomonas sp. Marseille-P4677 TaxID=2364790 RepID=UPI001913DABD
MVLEYPITDRIISSVVSISEKIGRIKEIRNAHKHIDFDMMCNIKNIQNTLHYLEISYPDKYITQLISNDKPYTNTLSEEGHKMVQKVIDLHIGMTKHKYPNIDNLVKEYNNSGLFRNIGIENITEKYKVSKSDNFFLYDIAEFCSDSFYKMDSMLEELLLISLFYKEYGMILYLPYDEYFEQEKFIDSKGVNHFYNAELLSKERGSKYPLYEFHLSIIDSIIEDSIEMHYRLTHPISDRVEILQGKIKEPFSRKDYMKYYDIST